MATPEARRGLASEIDELDRQIADLQSAKKDAFASYRDAYGKAECKAAQVAIRRRQKIAAGEREAMEEHETLVEEVLADICPRTRAAHVREEAA